MLLCAVGLTSGCTVFNREAENQKNVLKKLVDRESQSDASKSDDSEARAITDPSADSSQDSKEKVRFAGGLMLGDTDNVAFQPDEFRQTMVTLIEDQQWRSLKRTISIYPDLTMTLITEANGQNIAWSHVTIAARVLDLTWGLEGNDSWQKYVEQTAESAKKHRNFNRAEFLKLLSKDELKKAIDLKLVKSLGSSAVDLAKADALRLEGIAYLMLEDHDKSIAKLEKAYGLVYSSHPYFASHIGLMLGEAHRHAGDAENWKASWQEAVEVQSQWFEESGITDPTFWKCAAFLRPLKIEWPTPTIERLNDRLANEHLDFSNQGMQTTKQSCGHWWVFRVYSVTNPKTQFSLTKNLKRSLPVNHFAMSFNFNRPLP